MVKTSNGSGDGVESILGCNFAHRDENLKEKEGSTMAVLAEGWLA
jgi:hypothetical protein